MGNNGPRVRGGGTIGVISSDLARYSDFSSSLAIMLKPDGARLIWTKTTDVTGNCNTICRNMIGEWLWLMGDDHVFDPDILFRLLEHDVDIVVPLCFTRTPPFRPVVFSHQNEHDEFVVADLPEHGLHEIHAAGSAGMLIRRWVLDAIGDPWFETTTAGLNEDLTFCAKARAVGAKLFCDVDTPLGHIATHTVWPDYREEPPDWHPNLVLDAQTVIPLKNIRITEPETV